jgi:hypothetical protein
MRTRTLQLVVGHAPGLVRPAPTVDRNRVRRLSKKFALLIEQGDPEAAAVVEGILDELTAAFAGGAGGGAA